MEDVQEPLITNGFIKVQTETNHDHDKRIEEVFAHVIGPDGKKRPAFARGSSRGSDRMRVYDPVDIARQFLFVRELPTNRGQRVESIQHWSGGEPGQSWCAHFATMVLDICYQGASPIARTGSCDEILKAAKAKDWIVSTPALGDLVLSINPADQNDAHHVAICTGVEPLRAIAGNTSSDGISNNGDGVYEHEINPKNKLFVRVPV